MFTDSQSEVDTSTFKSVVIVMVSEMLQNSTTYYFHSTKIFIQLQQKYLFNFNKIYLFNFNKNIYSTSTKNNFIQQ